MNESRLNYLFRAYFNETATSDERSELMELLMQGDNDEQVRMLLAEEWQQFSTRNQVFTDKQGEEMLANILQEGKVGNPDVTIVPYESPFNWLRFAAAAILCFAITAAYLWFDPGKSAILIAQSKIKSSKTSSSIMPGGNRAVLTLSDSSHIFLDSTHQGILATQGNSKIMNLNSATLVYNADNQNNHEIVYNTLSTLNGGRYELILPDGTKVWLNASSSIRFPTVFKGKERKVIVTGETYFEVAKNAAMPFKITVKDMEIQVFGTHFNVMAYDDESSMNTTLLEGSVTVSKGFLNRKLVPGQESRINKTGSIDIVEADVDEVMAWKNGWFQFNAYDIERVMRQISRWYNVEIIYEGKIPPGHFSGVVSRSNDISQVLKIMQASGVRFKIEGRKVFVSS
ncbi:MAG: FecR domain-containing protein [Ginsengibacter sp.]